MNTLLHKIFSLSFALGLYLNAYSQQQNFVGLNVNGEIYPGKFLPSVGLTFEKQISTHNGFETGFFYRTQKLNGVTTYINTSGYYSYSFLVSERHLTFPILYKYYSNIVNFSIGPTVDYFLGWKQNNDGSQLQIVAYDVSRKFKVGFLSKISKFIPLNKQFTLEPELRFGSVQSWNDVGLGIGITGKYRF